MFGNSSVREEGSDADAGREEGSDADAGREEGSDADAIFRKAVDRLAEAAPELLPAPHDGWSDLFAEYSTVQRYRLRCEPGRSPLSRVTSEDCIGTGVRTVRPGESTSVSVDSLDVEQVRRVALGLGSSLSTSGSSGVEFVLHDSGLTLPPDAPEHAEGTECLELVRRALDAALSLTEGRAAVEVEFRHRIRRKLVGRSDGLLRAGATSIVALRVAVSEAGGSVHAIGGGGGGLNHFVMRTPEMIAREAADRLAAVRRSPSPSASAGETSVIFAGGWGAVWLHEAIGHLLEADTSHAYRSRVGLAVAPAYVTLVDDASLPGGRGSDSFDDEGTTSGRTVLIENGILRNLITDRHHAQALGMVPTGNGRRQDFRHPPLPRMTNLVLESGVANPTDLVAGAGDGILVTMPGGGMVNPAARSFSLDVLEGRRIRGGQLAESVSHLRVSGPLGDLFDRLGGVGSDLAIDFGRGTCVKAGQSLPVSVGMPAVWLRRLHVGPIEA